MLTVSSGADRAQASDLLVGDVWLCSGQSNMEYPVARALNGPGEVAGAGDGGLRLLTVPKKTAMQPQTSFGGPVRWAASSPQSASDFSAACYFMARDLRKALHVPIGAIHSSWGGSQARAWLSPKSGLALYGAADMAMLEAFGRDPLDAVTRFAPRWEQWYRGTTQGTEPWLKPDSLPWSAVPKIAGWLAWEGTPWPPRRPAPSGCAARSR
jgi:sialate O-acetylesterase